MKTISHARGTNWSVSCCGVNRMNTKMYTARLFGILEISILLLTLNYSVVVVVVVVVGGTASSIYLAQSLLASLMESILFLYGTFSCSGLICGESVKYSRPVMLDRERSPGREVSARWPMGASRAVTEFDLLCHRSIRAHANSITVSSSTFEPTHSPSPLWSKHFFFFSFSYFLHLAQNKTSE